MMKYTVHPIKLESELDQAFQRNKKYKWSDIYPTEEELISALIRIDVEIGEDVIRPTAPFYKGYEFIHSFAKQLQGDKYLSDKQMTQAKRLAKEIKKANIVMNHVKTYNKLEPSKLTNVEILHRYRYLQSSINNHIQYIENYEQQLTATKRNSSIEEELKTLIQILKKRSKGLCRVIGKYADVGENFVHIIKRYNSNDEILVIFGDSLYTCEEFKEEDYYFIPRNKLGKIDWLPVELENNEYLYYEFDLETALKINRGWWFKFYKGETECAIYDGDIFIDRLTNLTEHQINVIYKHCLESSKCVRKMNK